MPESVSPISSTLNGLKDEFGIIAHNLANVNTVGYKRRCNAFSQSLISQMSRSDSKIDKGIDLVTAFDFSQGELAETGRSLDFALSGRGFFVIETPEGPLYTRSGSFRLDPNGHIVDSQGRIVAGESGALTVPRNVGLAEITVSNDGRVNASEALIGKLRVVDFGADEEKLVAAGASCFVAPDGVKPSGAEGVVVRQGFQEASNVQMVEELVDMIMVSRLYEANMQLVSTQKDASRSILNVAMS